MKTYSVSNPLQHDLAGHHQIHDLQRALNAARSYHGPIDGIFGAGTGHACKDAKFRLGYPLQAVLPTGGQDLYNFLTGAKPLPAPYRARRRLRGYGLTRNERIRLGVVQWAHWGVVHTASVHYSQSRPIDGHRRPGKLPLYTDCSGFVTDCYEWAGGTDPNGFRFNGYGWTGTLLDHGVTIPLYQALPGDVVIWGWAPGHHTALIVDVADRANPMIVSHGSEAGPLLLRLSDEDSAQNRSRIVKRYIGL